MRSSGTSVTSLLSTTASGTASGATATNDTAVTAVPKKDGPPIGAIAGGAAGGALVLAIIVGLLVYYFCHAKKSRKGHEETISRRQSDLPAMAAAHDKDKGLYSPEGKYRVSSIAV
jgi:uncharacterized protein HemX